MPKNIEGEFGFEKKQGIPGRISALFNKQICSDPQKCFPIL